MQNVKPNPVVSILEWFEKAVPNPKLVNIRVQIGCHFEEVGEMLTVLNAAEQVPMRSIAHFYKTQWLADNSLLHTALYSDKKKAELFDALADQVVTAVGALYMLVGKENTMRILMEVCRSNESKFVNGEPVFDENGKIKKGENYTPPDLLSILKGNENGVG